MTSGRNCSKSQMVNYYKDPSFCIIDLSYTLIHVIEQMVWMQKQLKYTLNFIKE